MPEPGSESRPESRQGSRPESRPESNSAPRQRSRRARFLTWLRLTHLYLGLWAALLGLLFGSTGIVLNHRAILKLPVPLSQQKTVQLPLPAAGFVAAPELATWLQQHLQFGPQHVRRVETHPARQLQWGGQSVNQPERWRIVLARPNQNISAEYFVGNRFVQLEQNDATLIGTLARLHMAVGVNAFWVILSDTIGAALLVLSLSGLLLWTQLHTVRTLAVLISLAAAVAALGVGLAA